MSIKHIVLLKWNETVNDAAIADIAQGFQTLSATLPEIQSYQFGEDAGIYDNDYHYALVAEFASEADFKAYVAAEAHQAFMKTAIHPFLDAYTSAQFIV